MRKQYYARKLNWPWVKITLYHDGGEVNTIKTDLSREEEEIDMLEGEGYTAGFLPEDVLAAKFEYETMKANVIGEYKEYEDNKTY